MLAALFLSSGAARAEEPADAPVIDLQGRRLFNLNFKM